VPFQYSSIGHYNDLGSDAEAVDGDVGSATEDDVDWSCEGVCLCSDPELSLHHDRGSRHVDGHLRIVKDQSCILLDGDDARPYRCHVQKDALSRGDDDVADYTAVEGRPLGIDSRSGLCRGRDRVGVGGRDRVGVNGSDSG